MRKIIERSFYVYTLRYVTQINLTYQATVRAQNKGLNVTMNQLLKCIVRMRSIDDGTVRIFIVRGLGTQFTTEKLIDFAGRTMQAQGYIRNVVDNRFDTISRSFNLSIDGWHFVTIFRIIDRCHSSDINDGSFRKRHGDTCFFVVCLCSCLLPTVI
jgi:hypothetical protein